MGATIVARILGIQKAQSYATERALRSAWNDLAEEYPDLQLQIVWARELAEIQKYTSIFKFASLVINEKLVCAGRFPRRDEVVPWLRAAIKELSESTV